MEWPKVSIIIPVHNDSPNLQRCVESLLVQTYPAERLEFIVVDDGSTDGIETWFSRRFPEVTLLRKERTGPDHSRNLALQHASGEILGFIDSDCMADPDWVREGVSFLLKGETPIVTGPVLPGARIIDRMMALHEFGEFLGPQSRPISNFVTCNLFVRREVLQNTAFPAQVWMGGDRLCSWRLHQLGFKMHYRGPMRVSHIPDMLYSKFLSRINQYSFKMIAMRLADPTLPGGNLMRFSFLTPFLFSGARCLIDLRNLLRMIRPLNIPFFQVLLLFLSVPLLRTLDLFFMERFLIRNGLKTELDGHGKMQ